MFVCPFSCFVLLGLVIGSFLKLNLRLEVTKEEIKIFWILSFGKFESVEQCNINRACLMLHCLQNQDVLALCDVEWHWWNIIKVISSPTKAPGQSLNARDTVFDWILGLGESKYLGNFCRHNLSSRKTLLLNNKDNKFSSYFGKNELKWMLKYYCFAL